MREKIADGAARFPPATGNAVIIKSARSLYHKRSVSGAKGAIYLYLNALGLDNGSSQGSCHNSFDQRLRTVQEARHYIKVLLVFPGGRAMDA
jgi:hypothetical protein